MPLRFHEIAESRHRILNPLSEAKLDLVGRICDLSPGQRQLDLACGKGEMLARFARDHGTTGVGVDLSEVFLAAAAERAAELGVADSIEFVHADAGLYEPEPGAFDVASCIGATWIGGGLRGTLDLLRPTLRGRGQVLVGEVFWNEEPSPAAHRALGTAQGEFTTLAGTLDRFHAAGMELVEMVAADADSWDRYAAAQWRTIDDWLAANPDDLEAGDLRAWIDGERRAYLEHGRRLYGWAVFVLRPR